MGLEWVSARFCMPTIKSLESVHAGSIRGEKAVGERSTCLSVAV